jgi:hypothetical protein
LRTNAIAFVIWIVCVRPEPWSGRSDAIRYFALPLPSDWMVEHDEAGSAWIPLDEPLPPLPSVAVLSEELLLPQPAATTTSASSPAHF